MACQSRNARGKPCSAPHYRDGYCYAHHPGTEAAMAEARRKGGENSANHKRAERKMVNYTIPHVRVVLSTAMNEVFEGRMDIGLAAALATLGRAVITANEKSELEARIAELEKRAGIVTDERIG